MKTIAIQYHFKLINNTQETFNLELDEKSLELVASDSDNLPHWTKLGFHQCANCPLNIDSDTHCPLAASLVNIVSKFNKILSSVCHRGIHGRDPLLIYPISR